MKTQSKISLFLLLLLTLLPVAHAQVVEIPDPGLRSVIRQTLNKPTGDITVADMESLIVLGAWSMAIHSLEGLQTAKNLVSLDLTFNHLTDIVFLRGLSSLQTLTLWFNPLTNLTLPEGLSSLQTLDLGHNSELTSLTLPEVLTNLQTLSIVSSQFTNLNLPDGLSSLQTLHISQGQLTSLTLPDGLSSLQTLYLPGNQLTSLTLPEGLTSLQTLYLPRNQLTSLTVPWQLASLTELHVDGNPLAELKVYESIFGQLQVEGFPRERITLLPANLRFDLPFVAHWGGLQLRLNGPTGRQVRVQRSTNLVDWEDWQTVTLEGTAVELSDDPPAPGSHYFYRAVEIPTDPGP